MDDCRSGPFGRFLLGQHAALLVEPDGRMTASAPPPPILLPGSFNPLHHGHEGLARAASSLTGKPAFFELTIVNADKAPLDGDEVRRRLSGFAWRAPVWLTRAPTFAAKARLFPGTTFVVGVDTAARVVQPRFYGDSETQRDAALAELRAAGCRFLVAGRADGSKRFWVIDDLEMPVHLRDLFTGIPAEHFRADISSTQLRSRF
jgi:hypothetical protein